MLIARYARVDSAERKKSNYDVQRVVAIGECPTLCAWHAIASRDECSRHVRVRLC